MALDERNFNWYLGRAILRERKKRGLTQGQLGAVVGLEKQKVSRLERSGSGLTHELLQRIAAALNTTGVDLYDVAFEWKRRELLAAIPDKGRDDAADAGVKVKRLALAIDQLEVVRAFLDDLISVFEHTVENPEIFLAVTAQRRSRRLADLPDPPQPRRQGRRARKR